jgi:hypothetical protein
VSGCLDCSGSECICRTREMIAWARSRIEECRRQEQKFGMALGRPGRVATHSMPQALIEAWTERQALEAVLAQLGVNEIPRLSRLRRQ